MHPSISVPPSLSPSPPSLTHTLTHSLPPSHPLILPSSIHPPPSFPLALPLPSSIMSGFPPHPPASHPLALRFPSTSSHLSCSPCSQLLPFFLSLGCCLSPTGKATSCPRPPPSSLKPCHLSGRPGLVWPEFFGLGEASAKPAVDDHATGSFLSTPTLQSIQLNPALLTLP